MKRAGLDVLESKRHMVELNTKLDLHTRVLYKLSTDVSKVLTSVTKYQRPIAMDAQTADPLLNTLLTKFIPLKNREQELALFNPGPGETDETVRTRLMWLRRFIMTKEKWNENTFVSRMIPHLLTPDFRRAHFCRGNKQ